MLIELRCQLSNPDDPWAKTYFLNGQALSPEKSLNVVRHSPNGFNHGYHGSGPSQLALAVCLELFGRDAAIRLYQQFKDEHITTLGHGGLNKPQHEDFTVLLDVTKYAELAGQ